MQQLHGVHRERELPFLPALRAEQAVHWERVPPHVPELLRLHVLLRLRGPVAQGLPRAERGVLARRVLRDRQEAQGGARASVSAAEGAAIGEAMLAHADHELYDPAGTLE